MSAPATLPPSRPWRGSVAACAFQVDPRLVGDAEARRRVLAAWTPGARVLDVDGTSLLVLAGEVRVRCDRAPGLPFVRSGGRLLAAPAQLDGIDAPADALVWLDGGRVRFESLTRFRMVDVSSWLDPGSLSVQALEPWAAPPAAPRSRIEQAPPLDARLRLGVPAADAQGVDVRRLLLEGRKARSTSAPGMLTRLATSLRSLFSRAPRRADAPRPLPRAEAKVSRWAALRSRLARFLLQTQLAQIVGRHHAKYLRRMLDLFESGDVQDALRHAIPLGNDLQSKLTTLALPRPRSSLSIRPGGGGPTSAWSLGTDLYQHLQRTYRAMFARLEAQGRIEEAAFVLAELLRSDHEAVAFLERHGRLRLAAELAEGRALPPELQVRQWLLAGETDRAVALAFRHGVFGQAAMELDKGGPVPAARVWRLLWADALAEAGDMLGAADVAIRVPGARHLALGWLESAIAQGGPTGAQALVRKVELRPEAFADVRDPMIALLADATVEGLPTRVAFVKAVAFDKTVTTAKGVRAPARGPERSVMARAAVRAMVRDTALHGSGRIPPDGVQRLLAAAGDGALRADVPSLDRYGRTTLLDRKDTLVMEWPASDVGRAVATDAAFLPDGRVVAALGEMGVRLYHRDGRELAHFDQPAHRLVVSDNGDRVIALAERGAAKRLARIDLVRRQAASWCDAAIGCFAEDYDGRYWFVGLEDDLYAIDAAAPRLDALWRVPDIHPTAIRRTDKRLHVLGWENPGELERFSYAMPGLVLRDRDDLPVFDGERAEESWLSESGHCVVVAATTRDPSGRATRLMVFPGHNWESLGPPAATEAGGAVLRMARDWFVVAHRAPDALRLELLGRPQNLARLTMSLAGSSRANVRLSGHTLTVADDRGRLIAIDLVHGRLLRDLRLA